MLLPEIVFLGYKKRKTIFPALFVMISFFLATETYAAPSLSAVTDLTQAVSLNVTELQFNKTTNTFDSVLTISNASQQPIEGPVTVAVYSLPEGVILSNATSISAEGIPLITISDTPLAVGGTITVNLQFINRTNEIFPISLRLVRLAQPVPNLELLQGPDANDNGVRDDLEPVIASRYASVVERNAASQVLKNMRSILAEESTEPVLIAARSLHRSFDCLYETFGTDKAEEEVLFLRNLMIDNPDRISAWTGITEKMAGQSVPVGSADPCD